MTVAELASRSGRSVEAIAAFALAGGAAPSSRAGARKPGRPPKASSGGGSFDDRVLAAIKAAGGEARSVDIENQVGGNPKERRAALHRLVKAKKLERSGVARATRYSLR